MPHVTAIVPTCRRPVLLERALRSIIAQAIVPTELIVVDDAYGSHGDAVRHVVDRCGLKRALLVANSHTRGVSGARNTGADFATGELLAFLDDDDEWLPLYIREALALFESQGLDMTAAGFFYHSEDGTERPGKIAPDRLIPELFLTRNPGLGGSNFIIRRSLYREIGGFNEQLSASEDKDFGIRLSLQGGVRYEPLRKWLVRVHKHAGPRLCMPRGEAMRAGVRRFYELHEHRMTAAQRAEFRSNVRRVWGLDERGQSLNLSPKAFFDSLLPILKARLDRQRQRPKE